MIFNDRIYNPLEVIFQVLPDNYIGLTTGIMDIIQKELFKAGVVPETGEEFTQVVELLIELKKEFNG